jgi:methylmalonyl-CoA mutase N-terminal domain/subunit
VDLTRQQPLNNIARVTTQAIAGILGGLQSLHTDAYDEVLSVPTEDAARIAVNTQNILREEAHLTDVIDPLGGAYYVETLTNDMEDRIRSVMERIESCGGMYQAVQDGVVQTMIGDSALDFQHRLDSGEQTLVGVNRYRNDAEEAPPRPLERPDEERIDLQLAQLDHYRRARDQGAVDAALERLAGAANSADANVYSSVVDAALADATHGEIVACLRREFGDGVPLILP